MFLGRANRLFAAEDFARGYIPDWPTVIDHAISKTLARLETIGYPDAERRTWNNGPQYVLPYTSIL